MGLSEILSIVTIVLLFLILLLQLTGRRKSGIGKIAALLKRTAEEQRDVVQRQIAQGATEQFTRFGVMQKSMQDTLSDNRRTLVLGS